MASDVKPRVISSSVFVASPADGVSVMGGSYYTRATGVDLMSVHTLSSRSDILSHEYYRFSGDNGRTWSEPTMIPAGRATPDGMLRRHQRGGYLDPATGRFIRLRNEAVLPHDEVNEFMSFNTVHYSVSVDGGRTDLLDEPIVQAGGFNPGHPLPGVWRGRNCFMLGDSTCQPITLPDGTLLLPVQISPTGPDGQYENRGGGFTFTDCAVIRGRWRADGRIDWERSDLVAGDPARSSRGLIEPTLARLTDGRILMVMRGSNDRRPDLPGFRWFSLSADGGRTWSTAEPWTYASGERFFSPSSCSQLLHHHSGRLFWIGNLCPENPEGNAPRHPIVIGEVSTQTGLLIRETVAVIDDRRPDDGPFLTLSNFYARDDREDGRIKLHLLRCSIGGSRGYQGDCLLYDIEVNP